MVCISLRIHPLREGLDSKPGLPYIPEKGCGSLGMKRLAPVLHLAQKIGVAHSAALQQGYLSLQHV
jgi:hypothetical protein